MLLRKTKNKRRYLTLIEVLIGLALTMLLLTTLSYFYREVNWMNLEFEKSQKEGFHLSYIENRLADILPNSTSPTDKYKDFAFYTASDANGLLKSGQPSLVFAFNNGVELSKEFSGHVLGRLYVDKEGNLVLGTWPSYKRWERARTPPLKKEVLMDHVESLTFEFYVPPGKPNTNGKTLDIEPKNAWHKEWKYEYQKLPALIRMTISQKDHPTPMIFIFPIINSDMVIHYDR